MQSGFHTRPYRFWPIYGLAYLKAFYFALYGLALPNYLIFDVKIPPSMVGAIVSAYALAYIIGPLVGDNITKKMGIKNAVSLSVIVSVITLLFQVIFINPYILLVCRALDGLFAGLYWPNLQLEMCNWQKISTPERCDEYYRYYSMAWNLGLLVGYLLGAVLVLFLGSDFLVIIIAWVCACLMIPTAYLIEKKETPLIFIENCAVIIIGRASAVPLDIHSYRSTPIDMEIDGYADRMKETTQKPSSSPKGNHLLSSFSFTLVVFAALSFSILKSFYTFVFPYFLEMQEIPSYWVYIVIFFQQFIQFILIRWLSNRGIKNRWNIFLIGFVLGWSFTFLFFVNPSLWFITVITIIIGAVHAMLYTLSTQIMLDKGTKTGSSKYASYYEAIIGAGFGITPIMAGYIVEYNILLNFPIIGLLIFICFTICYVMGKRVFAYNKLSQS